VMIRDGGHVYVYLCYGMYELLNFVVAKEGEPEAVLIRAVYPLEGWSAILRRRNSEKWKKGLMSGPGKVTQGLSITREMNGTRIGDKILLYDIGISIPRGIIKNGPRIGVDYAGPDALLPYRFWCEEEDIIRLLSSTRALSDNRPQGNKD
ncbi:MAG: DNA-3-methyladenine glycosylase, partial [Bacteroidia bacterium]|nr:DNA-3-methyladenine glycosylase [Bacteroidia bacterium]